MLSALLLALPLIAPAQDAAVEKAPTAEQITAAVIDEQLPSYPLSTCVISGKDLGSMGDPLDLIVEGRLVRVCCKGCVKRATKGAADVIAKIDAAVIAQQGPSYPIDTCVISGEALDSMGGPKDVVVGTRLVKVCCKGCVKRVKKDVAAALAPVNAGLMKAQRVSYGLTTCLFTGKELGDEPKDFLYGTRLVRVCCKRCVKGFKRNPTKHLAALDAAQAEAKKKARK